MSSAQVNTALIPEVVVKSNFIQDKRFAPTLLANILLISLPLPWPLNFP